MVAYEAVLAVAQGYGGVVVVTVALLGSLAVVVALLLGVFSSLCCCLKPAVAADDGETKPSRSGSERRQPDPGPGEEGGEGAEIEGQASGGDGQRSAGRKNGFFLKREHKPAPPGPQSAAQAGGVRDRITLFETSGDHAATPPRDNLLRDNDGKPRKKKPTSKAFQEFETKGIMIGFGRAPRQRTSSSDTPPGEDGDADQSGSAGSLDLVGGPPRPRPPQARSHSNSLSRLTDDEGIHTMDEEDDFNAVTRNSEVLKSFRRAPPPKNRSKAHRPLRQRIHDNHSMQGVPGFDFPLEQDEDDDTDSHPTPSRSTDSIHTPSRSTDSIHTPSRSIDSLSTPGRLTPDTATSGHMTGEDSPHGGESPRGNTPDTDPPTGYKGEAPKENPQGDTNVIRRESSHAKAQRIGNSKTESPKGRPPVSESVIAATSGSSTTADRLIVSASPSAVVTMETEVFQSAPVSRDQTPVVRMDQSEHRSSPGAVRRVLTSSVYQSVERAPAVTEAPPSAPTSAPQPSSGPQRRLFTSRTQLKSSMSQVDARETDKATNQKPRSLSTSSSPRDADKLTLTRPRSFHPTSFSRWDRRNSEDTPTRPANQSREGGAAEDKPVNQSTGDRASEATPNKPANQGRVLSMIGEVSQDRPMKPANQGRAQSMVGGASGVLRQWERDLAVIDVKRRRTDEPRKKECEHDPLSPTEGGKTFKAKWETAI